MKVSDRSIRVANWIIDTAVLVVVMVLLIFFVYLIYPRVLDEGSLIFEIVYFVSFFSYYFFFEAFTGRTVGKFLTKSIVVTRNGGKPKSINIAVRTLVRLVPIEGLTFLFGTFGLHDLISKTTVVDYKKT
jgi:uncharacterized RDD family membrane protein YckC